MRADFHIHTYYSDGSFPPETLVDLAEKSRLDYLAITDHDCFASCEAASRAIQERGLSLKLIPASEFTAMLDGEEIHVHGYFKEFPSAKILEHAERVQAERRERIRTALERLATINVHASMNELPAHPDCKSLTQLHLAFLLIEKNYAQTVPEARNVFLHDHVLPKFTMSAEVVIQTITREGGLAVWAHPEENNFDRNLQTLAGFGLSGVEVYNLRRQEKPSRRFLKAARKKNLVTTLGSDWHGHSHEYLFDSELEGEKILGEFLEKLYQ